MGLYDREYGRDEQTPWERRENPRSITITLIVVNVAIFFADTIFAKQGESLLAPWFGVQGNTLTQPWMWWQLLSYGFVHDIRGITHILFNMIGLYFFGRIVEQRIGRIEFLKFYLIAVFVGGVVGGVSNLIYEQASGHPALTIGASGAVIASVILFACYYPNQQIYLMMVFPVKAWVAAAMFIALDLMGAFGMMQNMGSQANTAFTVHLAGAGFALLYYFRRWNLRWLDFAAIAELPARMRDRSRRMKLKLHDPDKKIEKEARDADQILAKISQFGESSLTASERKTLERYSRRQREKRNQ